MGSMGRRRGKLMRWKAGWKLMRHLLLTYRNYQWPSWRGIRQPTRIRTIASSESRTHKFQRQKMYFAENVANILWRERCLWVCQRHLWHLSILRNKKPCVRRKPAKGFSFSLLQLLPCWHESILLQRNNTSSFLRFLPSAPSHYSSVHNQWQPTAHPFQPEHDDESNHRLSFISSWHCLRQIRFDSIGGLVTRICFARAEIISGYE